mmetsp:Transcript_3199/g.14417  ORF Transcript_3199/g.14417 Transcript_3199/m.14417 type:complete len:261 (+) Transcript_3199:2246-3028(+)
MRSATRLAATPSPWRPSTGRTSRSAPACPRSSRSGGRASPPSSTPSTTATRWRRPPRCSRRSSRSRRSSPPPRRREKPRLTPSSRASRMTSRSSPPSPWTRCSRRTRRSRRRWTRGSGTASGSDRVLVFALLILVTASGPVILTVAVGKPIVPHTTCTSSSFHDTDVSSVFPLPPHVTSAMISSSSTPPVFCSATSLKRSNISLSSSPSSGKPSCLSLDFSACLPLCLPMTTPTSPSPRKYPIVSGAMISYVCLFLSMPS